MKYHVLHVDGTVSSAECWHKGLDDAVMREIVGGPLEFVKVLRDGVAAHMVVNECGTGEHGHPRLTPNVRATAIYWENTIVWNVRQPEHAPMGPYDPLTAPMIHGVAILYEGLLP